MPLGWIDFSRTERNKVLSVLDNLSEPGTLDELGISPIRDGFADIFFPGTSTIQTRAKYFLIIPYALKDMERNNTSDPNQFIKEFDKLEEDCARKLLEKTTEGIIGNRSLKPNGGGAWVKRTPAAIYWAGLHKYGIFTKESLSLVQYIRAVCALKKQKANVTQLGNRNDYAEENEVDDKDAGWFSSVRFWDIPAYSDDWKANLSIKLTSREGLFLKNQIITRYPDSMMAHILEYNQTYLDNIDFKSFLDNIDFKSLCDLIQNFPQQIQVDYRLAVDFSDFLFVIRTLYNKIVSEDENKDATEQWEKFNLPESANKVDLEAIFSRIERFKNRPLSTSLKDFLLDVRICMKNSDIEGMKSAIIIREHDIKRGREKTLHPEKYDHNVWYGGRELDYRFNNAKVIMKDIFESEGQC